MPALWRYADAQCAMVTELFDAWMNTGQQQLRTHEIEPVRFRPGIAATMRWRIADMKHRNGEDVCFVKLAAGGATPVSAQLVEAIEAASLRGGVELSFSMPHARNEPDGAALYKPARGRSLHALLASASPLSNSLEITARALAGLHRMEVHGMPAACPQRILAKLERAARLISWACPEHSGLVACVLRRARDMLAMPVVGPTHGDMKTDHIFLSEGSRRVVLIDSDALASANPLMDAGSLVARMRAMPGLDGVAAARIRTATVQFREAYLDRIDRGWRSLLPIAEAASALLVCQHTIQRLAPGWRQLVAAELEHAALAT